MRHVWLVTRYWDDAPVAVTSSWQRALEAVYVDAIGRYADSADDDQESAAHHGRINIKAPDPENWTIKTLYDAADDAASAEVVFRYGVGNSLEWIVNRYEVID